MEILITFPEIQELIKKKTDKDIILNMVDNKTIKITYSFSVKIPLLGKVKKDISLNVSIEDINGTNVCLAYDYSLSIDMMISGAQRFIQEDSRLNFVEFRDTKQILLKLGKIEQLKTVFDKVDIQSVSVMETGFRMACKLKDI